jgi:cytochrome c-type biogenesis protein CcmH/NrfG
MNGLQLPDLYQAGLDKRFFDQPEDIPVGEILDDGSKVFRLNIRLRSADVAEIPALEFSYFDSSKASYVTSKSRPIALSAEGSTVISASNVVSAEQNDSVIGSGKTENSSDMVSLTGANLRQSDSSQHRSAWRVSEVLLWICSLYLVPVFLFTFMWGRKKTAGGRALRGASSKRTKELKEALSRAEKNNLRESSGAVRIALKEISKHDDVDCQELLDELEQESYSPNSGTQTISKELYNKIFSLFRTLGVVWVLSFTFSNISLADSSPELYDVAMSQTDRQSRMESFDRAARSYKEKLVEQPDTSELWVDWGNASLGAGKYGDAMVGYSRALILNPRNTRAEQNRDWLIGKLPDWVRGGEAVDPFERFLFWSNWFNQAELLILGGSLFFLMICIRLFAPRWLNALSLFVGIIWVSVVLSSVWKSFESPMGVVQSEAGALKAADNEGAPSIRNTWIPEGTPVQIVRQTERWTEVKLPNGEKGWLPTRAVEELDIHEKN